MALIKECRRRKKDVLTDVHALRFPACPLPFFANGLETVFEPSTDIEQLAQYAHALLYRLWRV